MPRQNRVLPTGEIIAHPARGMFMGNRGILHDDTGRLTHRRWRYKAWVTCVLDFKGRRRPIMAPGAYTELFFHDEAVALAAGHRPCGECRRADYLAYRAAAGITGPIKAFDMELHAARAVPRRWAQRRHVLPVNDLPDGAFLLDDDGTPCLVRADALYPFAPGGYGPPRPRPRGGTAQVLTPPPTLEALRNGYRPVLGL